MKISKLLAEVLKISIVLLVVSLATDVKESTAAPMLTAKSSTTQARKGEFFKVYLQIMAQESMKDIKVSIIPPSGFEVSLESKDIPNVLESGSSFTMVYKVQPPGPLVKYSSPGADTREQKIFVFNIAYTSQVDNQPHQFHQSIELTVDFSMSSLLYLMNGLIGLILGNMIKTLTSHKEEIQQQLQETGRRMKLLRASTNLVFRKELVVLLTAIAVGFIVLLVLSRDKIPTKGYYDTIAIGVAVAILSDDQLLTKVKSVIPGR